MEYYIFVTNDCNLNCKYCSVLLKKQTHNIPETPIYSLDELNDFIHTMQNQNNDDCADIVFFGGEPTLNFQFIRELIESQKQLRNNLYKIKYMLHTNGILLSNIPNDILRNIDAVMLSINYDLVPHDRLNEGYFKTLTDSIKSIKSRKNIPVIGRLTITEKTSLYSEVTLFHTFFDAIYWQIENCYTFSDFLRFYESYKYELELTFNLWLAFLQKGVLLNLIPFIASSSFAINKESPDTFCCGYNDSIIFIQTNGSCYTCAEDMTTMKNIIGDINKGIIFDEFSLKDTNCHSCEYIYMCRGRCGRMHREFQKEHISEYCKLNQLLFDLILKNLPIINKSIKEYELSFNMDNSLYHYTEYTP